MQVKQKKHIWEMNGCFFCPITGYCLSYSEQAHIFKKCNADPSSFSDYQKHQILMKLAQHQEKEALRIERLLNFKYKYHIELWGASGEKEWCRIISRDLSSETYGAILWISAVYIEISDNCLENILGKLHMFAHFQTQAAARLNREFAELKARYQELEQKYLTTASQLGNLKGERNSLRMTVDMQSVQLNNLNKRLSEEKKENSHRENGLYYKNLLKKKNHIILGLRQEIKESEENIKDLRMRLSCLVHAENGCCPSVDPETHDLRNQRVLIVGGMSKFRALYEDVVTDLGGLFDYHDGRMKGGSRLLEEKISRSDVVLCPVDVNSHRACLCVKKECKKYNTPYFMLQASGKTTIHRKLTEWAVAHDE